jgi:hypothetical protein
MKEQRLKLQTVIILIGELADLLELLRREVETKRLRLQDRQELFGIQ